MTFKEAGEKMLCCAILILPASALATLPFLLMGTVLNDMSAAKLIFVLYEIGGAVLGLTLD